MGSACGVYPRVNGKVAWPWLVRRGAGYGAERTEDSPGLGGVGVTDRPATMRRKEGRREEEQQS